MITNQHPEWPAYRRKLEEKIEALRDRLEQPMVELDTAEVRGRVAAFRELIEEIDPKVPDAPQRSYT